MPKGCSLAAAAVASFLVFSYPSFGDPHLVVDDAKPTPLNHDSASDL
jgi:hypothetical protein